ncbi:hypothetical protein LPC27_09560 [Paraclostridium bifermentans]|uniref:hypothetical protein n=2 Tax=Bacillota TaxID=1239 RepID=UPI001F27F18C|nr:hypothetical protein [Paraclostridium bifermentans]MCE9676013.1 hypothetical protein [Paraclostridium bifermentans]
MAKKEDKIKICRKYRVYLEVMFIIGNGVILQKQFYEICRKLNISISDYQTRKILIELENAQIIKKQNFLYSKNKLIIIRKFGIRFLLNKASSNQVSSLPKNVDKRAIYSVFKLDRIIKIIDAYDLYNWDNFLEKMYDLNSSLIYNKQRGIFYHEMLIQKYNLNLYQQEAYLRCVENNSRMLRNLKKGKNKDSTGMNIYEELYDVDSGLVVMKNSNLSLDKITIDTLISSNIHIQSITDLVDIKIVEILIMDVNNTQNINKIIDNIIIACAVMRDIFKNDDIDFRFRILAWDEVSKNNIKSILGRMENYQQTNYIRSRLGGYKVGGRNILLDLKIDVDDIVITISCIDFYEKYLGGMKLKKYI